MVPGNVRFTYVVPLPPCRYARALPIPPWAGKSTCRSMEDITVSKPFLAEVSFRNQKGLHEL